LQDWRSLNLAYWRAQTALDSLNGQLDKYLISSDKEGTFAKTPNNVLYQCKGAEPITKD
jgi:hypothetical protein